MSVLNDPLKPLASCVAGRGGCVLAHTVSDETRRGWDEWDGNWMGT